MEPQPFVERSLRLTSGADALATIRSLWQGPMDPQMRVERGGTVMRAMRLASGSATLRLNVSRAEIVARAWGAGADEALDLVPALVGDLDQPPRDMPFAHRLVADLFRRLPGLRLTSGTPVIEALVPSIIGQKVTSFEARRSHRTLLVAHGERAPSPYGLMLPPPPAKLAQLPYWAFHPLGLERRRADTIRAAAAVAPRLEKTRALAPTEALRTLQSVPGIGPWTAAETVRLALGDPDAVSIGDYHLPALVCFALTGSREGGDERMLELLEPYRGQRARVVLLIEHSGLRPERRGPRYAPRSIAAI
ncbi:3-methyladenine DNA glycosylase [soil metagenome]